MWFLSLLDLHCKFRLLRADFSFFVWAKFSASLSLVMQTNVTIQLERNWRNFQWFVLKILGL